MAQEERSGRASFSQNYQLFISCLISVTEHLTNGAYRRKHLFWLMVPGMQSIMAGKAWLREEGATGHMASTVNIQRRIDGAGSCLSPFYPPGTLLHGMVRPKQLNPENSSKINPGVSFYGDSKFYLVSKINYMQYLLGSD